MTNSFRAFGFSLLLVVVVASHAASLSGRVIGISDGDTLTLLTEDRRRIRIRLAGIDAPEFDQPYGAKAKQALATLAFGQEARVEVVDRDDYGRIVGTVYVGALHVNAALVEQGAAWVYRQYNHDPRLPGLEAGARSARRGLWALPADQRIPPWDWRHGKKTAVDAPPATSAFRCEAKRLCGEMSSCEEARFYLNVCGLKRLDADRDGTPCETLCQ